MKVHELIARLQDLPPDLEVLALVDDEDGFGAPIVEATVERDKDGDQVALCRLSVESYELEDHSHLVVGQCSACFGINRHEPNCPRRR